MDKIRLGRTGMMVPRLGLEKCPYELPIREMLAEQVRYFREAQQRYEQKTGA